VRGWPQGGQRLLGHRSQGFKTHCLGRALLGTGELDDIGYRQGRGLRQPGQDLILGAAEALQQHCIRRAHRTGGAVHHIGTQLHLAAPYLFADQLAQGGLEGAQLV
jgi:hypothetical protein